MALRLLAIAFGAALISLSEASATPHPPCKANEVHKSCGPQVEATCDNLDDLLQDRPNSGVNCTHGCYCVADYVRDDNRNCIPVSSCPIDCPDNSEYSSSGGTLVTCKRPRAVSSSAPGCYCNDGFVLETSSDTCIPWEECPCEGQNQVYSSCVPMYPKTCNHRSNNINHTICLENWKGCVCKSDCVEDENRVCIPISECPPTICEVNCAKKKNEIYVANVNEIRCDMKVIPNPCKKGCQCIKGYARDKSGTCIPLDQCPCPANATFALEVSACPATCSLRNGGKCTDIKPAGCKCNPGYILNSIGKCILEEECHSNTPKCSAGQEYVTSGIEYFCQQPSRNVTNSCICANGMWYDDFSKSCVEPTQCRCPSNMVYITSGILNYCSLGRELIENGCGCPDGMSFVITTGTCVKTSECPKCFLPTCPRRLSYFAVHYQKYCNQPDKLLFNECGCPRHLWYDEYTKSCVKPGNCSCPDTMVHSDSGYMDYCGLGEEMITNKCSCPDKMSYDINIGKCVPTSNCSNCMPPTCPLRQVYFAISYQHFCNQPSKLVYNSCGCPALLWYDEYTERCVSPRDCSCPPTMIYETSGLMEYCGLGQEVIKNKCTCPDGMSYDINLKACVPKPNCSLCLQPSCPSGQSYFAMNYQQYCYRPAELLYNQCGCPFNHWYDDYAKKCVRPGSCTCPTSMVFVESGELHYCNLKKELIHNQCGCKDDMYYDTSVEQCVEATECSKRGLRKCPAGQVYSAIIFQQYCNQPSKFLYNSCGCLNGQWYDEYTASCVHPGKCNCPKSMEYIESGLTSYCGLGTELVTNECGCPTGRSYDLTKGKCVRSKKCSVIKPPYCSTGQQYFAIKYQLYCNQPAQFLIDSCACTDGYWYDEYSQQCVPPGNCSCPTGMVYEAGILDYCGLGREKIEHKCTCPAKMSFDISLGQCVSTEKCTKPTLPICPSRQSYFAITYQNYCHQPAKFLFNACGCPVNKWYDEYSQSCVSPGNCTCPETMTYYKSGVLDYCGLGKAKIINNCGCPKGKSYDITLGICVSKKKCNYSDLPYCSNGKGFFAFTYQSNCNKPGTFVHNNCACSSDKSYNEDSDSCVDPEMCPLQIIEKVCPSTMTYTKKGRLYYCGNRNSEFKRNDCICPPGYRYDTIKSICVLPRNCSYSNQELNCRKQDPNKEYHDCKSTSCMPTCDNLYPKRCTDTCYSGCFCRAGLIQVSETNKTCVLPSQCPESQCGPNSSLSTSCTSSVRCDNMYLNFKQTYCDGVSRCICDPGYVLNSEQDCVLPSECDEDEIVCPENMEYSTCHSCERQCDNLDPICTKQCRIGCFCKDGYAKNSYGVCVRESDCPSECPENEEYTQCVSLNPDTCANFLTNPKPVGLCKEVCKAGCDCKFGYVRNENNTCIDPSCCLPLEFQCDANQYYSPGPSFTKYCESLTIGNYVLSPGCNCNFGLVFDRVTGDCVDKTMCTDSKQNQDCKANDPNSVYSTCPLCPRTCADHTPICNEMCEPGCECASGYILTTINGICIPETYCPIIDPAPCPNNTTFQECVFNQKCSNIMNQFILPLPCTEGCGCMQGYLENSNGDCVLPIDCDSDIGCELKDPNSEFQRCGTCRKTCDKLFPVCDRMCHIGCFCKPEYVLDKPNGVCIPKRECFDLPDSSDNESDEISSDLGIKCPPNATPTKCKNICPERCPSRFKELFVCPHTKICTPGCNCKKDYVLNAESQCVERSECPPICENNLQYSEEPNELQTCESYFSSIEIPLETSNCICPIDMVYDGVTNSCIDPSFCSNAVECGPNMVYRQINTCHRTCSTYDQIQNYMCVEPTVLGCDCIDGYVLNSIDECVLPEDCINYQCSENMNYEISNRPRSCEDLTASYLETIAACFCKPGYLLDDNDDCILEENCIFPTTCPYNMHFDECYSSVETCNGTIYYFVCQPGCVCDDDLVLDDQGFCIPKDECQPIIAFDCPVNQTYQECPKCGRNCENYYLDIMFKCACIPGCACDEGYTRNSDHDCVLVEDCTEEEIICPDDQFYCNHMVRQTCTYPEGDGYTSGCFCEDDFVYDEVTRKCIDVKECLNSVENLECQALDPNSVFRMCQPNPLQTCNGDVFSTGICESGCYCKDGYILNSEEGQCVEECKYYLSG